MKKYGIILLLLITQYPQVHCFIKDPGRAIWKKYVEWRNPEIVQALKYENVDKQKAELPFIVNTYYEKDKPLYITWLSKISPLESEESVIKRGYSLLQNFYMKAFKNINVLDLPFSKDITAKISQDLESIRTAILRGTQSGVNVTKEEFNGLKNAIIKFKTDMISKTSKQTFWPILEELNEKLEKLANLVEKLSKKIEEPRIPAIERWHRNRVLNRIQEYFRLK